ncbi:hypothetical protein J2T17_004740 [Paenibacillus mucilaginosus]
MVHGLGKRAIETQGGPGYDKPEKNTGAAGSEDGAATGRTGEELELWVRKKRMCW